MAMEQTSALSGAGSGAALGTSINPGWGTVIGAGIGGAAGLFGASGQQASSEKMAQQQMDFQQYMSNTAHRREVKDLRKAGLNPLLSVNKGASSPAGAMGTAQNIAGTAATTAMQSARMTADLKLLDAQTRKVETEINPIEWLKGMGDSLGIDLSKAASILGLELGSEFKRVIANDPKSSPNSAKTVPKPSDGTFKPSAQPFNWKDYHQDTHSKKSRLRKSRSNN